MYHIISVDLDGTLLTPQNKITEYTKHIIQLLIEKKFYCVLSSGRHYIDILQIQNNLNIKTFIISSNGARVYDLNRKLIFKNNLDSKIAYKLCQIKYFDQEVITQVYCDDQWYINNNKINNHFCPSISNLSYKYFHPDFLDTQNISKIFFTSLNTKKLDDLQKEIINIWGNGISTSFSAPVCLEIVAGQTSKGNSLKLVSESLGLCLKNCVSFGDGMNDYDMLRMSGKGCIMKNGDPRLKKALPKMEIIGNNAHDGVAIFLYNNFIKKQ